MVVESHHGTQNTLEGDVVRSGAISNGTGSSEEDSVCLRSTETFRLWSNSNGSFKQQLSFQEGVPSRLSVALVSSHHTMDDEAQNTNSIAMVSH